MEEKRTLFKDCCCWNGISVPDGSESRKGRAVPATKTALRILMDAVGQRWTDRTIRSFFLADGMMVVSKLLHGQESAAH